MKNKEKVKEFFMQVGPARLVLVGICGIFLVIVSLPGQKKSTIKKENETKVTESGEENENEAYISKMEKRLVTALQTVDGVGKVQVMITLTASGESVVNKDTPYEESSEQELNGQKNSKSVKNQEQTVLVEEDGNQVPYVVKKYEPQVEGVIAVIEGGDDPVVVSQVTEAIQVLFHVEAHKIKVLKMEDGS